MHVLQLHLFTYEPTVSFPLAALELSSMTGTMGRRLPVPSLPPGPTGLTKLLTEMVSHNYNRKTYHGHVEHPKRLSIQ